MNDKKSLLKSIYLKRGICIAAILVFIFTLANCTDSEQPKASNTSEEKLSDNTLELSEEKQLTSNHPASMGPGNYQKPGASIRVASESHIFVETLEQHQTMVVLKTTHKEGILTVKVNADEGLSIDKAPLVFRFDLNLRPEIVLPLELLAHKDGRHLVNVLATIDVDNRRSARAMGLVVIANSYDSSAKNLQKPTRELPATESPTVKDPNTHVIATPAQEEIINH